MPTWPETVQFRPLAGSLVITPEPNVALFKPEVGGAYRRRRYPGSREVYRGTLQLTGPESDLLKAFFEEDCASGALAFDMYDWALLTHGALTMVEMEWEEPPETRHRLGLQFQVALTLSKTI